MLLARSLDRPMRYFLAKSTDGPVLIVSERIDEIAAELARHGWEDQFHPSYTRMVPAHHVTTLRLIGCPDPNPVHRALLRSGARHAVEGSRSHRPPVHRERSTPSFVAGLRRRIAAAPIGVPFSGGIDSGAILLCLYKLLLNEGQSPARLKAFTLSVDGKGQDARQAQDFLKRTQLEMLGEIIDVSVECARSVARCRRDRGLQAARCRMRRGESRAARRHS